MSFYTYQPLQQPILPNTLFLISELFSYKLAYSFFLPNRAMSQSLRRREKKQLVTLWLANVTQVLSL